MNNEISSSASSNAAGQMSVYPTITPPGALDAALAPLAELGEGEFQILLRETSTPRSFSLSSKGLKSLRGQLPSLATNLPFLLSALSFLYSRIDALGDLHDGFDRLIEKLVDELDFQTLDAEKKKLLLGRLRFLLKKNADFVRFRKIRSLQDGFIPSATSFRSMVDLRPDFGDGDAVKYQGLIRIIQFHVSTDSTNPELRDLVFQVNEETLEELRKTVDRAQKKLNALKSDPRLADQFIEID